MKIFLLILVCCTVGWFARDAIHVAWSAPTRTATIQVAPAKATATQAKPAPAAVKAQAPVKAVQPAPQVAVQQQYYAPSGYNLGQHVMQSGQWRVNPQSQFDENHPGDGWGSGYHGTPHDARGF